MAIGIRPAQGAARSAELGAKRVAARKVREDKAELARVAAFNMHRQTDAPKIMAACGHVLPLAVCTLIAGLCNWSQGYVVVYCSNRLFTREPYVAGHDLSMRAESTLGELVSNLYDGAAVDSEDELLNEDGLSNMDTHVFVITGLNGMVCEAGPLPREHKLPYCSAYTLEHVLGFLEGMYTTTPSVLTCPVGDPDYKLSLDDEVRATLTVERNSRP